MTLTRFAAAAALAVAATAGAAGAGTPEEEKKPVYTGPKTDGPKRMAFIDVSVITEKSEDYKKAKTDLEKRQDEAKKRVKTLEAKIKKLEDDYKAKESMLTDKRKKELQEEYQKLVEEYTRTGQGALRDLAEREAAYTQQLLTEIRTTVKAIAVQKNFDLVVEKTSVLYGSDDLGARYGDDITPDVLRILNKR